MRCNVITNLNSTLVPPSFHKSSRPAESSKPKNAFIYTVSIFGLARLSIIRPFITDNLLSDEASEISRYLCIYCFFCWIMYSPKYIGNEHELMLQALFYRTFFCFFVWTFFVMAHLVDQQSPSHSNHSSLLIFLNEI